MSFIARKTERALFVTLGLIYPSGFTGIPAQKEAAMLSSMASDAIFLLNHEQNRVAITVETDFFDFLGVTRFFALVPQLLS